MALERRLLTRSQSSGLPLSRLRKHVAFERLLPSAFPEPPPDWPARYERLARGLSITTDAHEAHRIVAAFLDPVLSGEIEHDARWDAAVQLWSVTQAT
jgi:hypothetical protein